MDPEAKDWINNIYTCVFSSISPKLKKKRLNTKRLEDKSIGDTFSKLKSLKISLRPLLKYIDRR